MRILAACSLGGAGHWQPLVGLLRAAHRRGDEVVVIAPPALQQMVDQDGFAFRMGGEPPESEIAPIRERLPMVSSEEASILGNRELFGRLAAAAMLAPMFATCREWAPDLVLRDPAEYSSAVVAGELAIPTAQVAISLATVEWGSIDVAAPALESHRSGLVHELRSSPYLTTFPGSLDRSRFETTLRFHAPRPTTWEALPDWWDGSTAPLVYLTMGTVLGYMPIAGGLVRTMLKAFDGLDVRVLLTVGRHFDQALLGRVASNVHVEPWVDQHRVLAEADLVVCHGGSGTVFGTVEEGLPLVVIPSFADQFPNGRLVAEHGLGLSIEAGPVAGSGRAVLDESESPRIAEAVGRVLGEKRFRERAGEVAAEMAATPTSDEILERFT